MNLEAGLVAERQEGANYPQSWRGQAAARLNRRIDPTP